MFKKLILTVSLLTLTHAAFAETCPTVSDLKNNNFNGWSAYDSDNGTPLNPRALENFKKNIGSFWMAEWADESPEGTSHCYYKSDYYPSLNGYLAKENLYPDLNAGHWNGESGFFRCMIGVESCLFKSERK